jgi:hypothetical protein
MKAALRREYTLAILLITASLISLTPTRANPLPQTHAITINATGQATRITDSGLSGPATLTLTAYAYNDSNQALQIQNATGVLQIDSANYTITNGHGNANKFGDIFIIGDTSPDTGQLFLHGTLQGNNLAFVSPESRLASLASLALSGSITTGTPQQTNPIATSTTSNNNSTVLSTHSNTTQNANMTLAKTQSNSSAENVTQTTTLNTTLVEQTNVTQLASTSGSNSTTTFSALSNQTVPYSPGTSNNVTVTVTQTVTDVTITNTITVTVANVTITQTNMTSTVNATATVTTGTSS